MAMGLAVMVVLLVGVMGAGLLVFVRNDLEAVVEVNRGQQALKTADAGIEAGRRHLRTVDATPANYDGDPGNDTDPSHAAWSELEGGRDLSFDGNEINVEIRYLLPSRNENEASQPDRAPEVLATGADCPDPADREDPDCLYPNDRNYFRVTAEGVAGNALRKVQAIYRTQNFDIPVAYFATRDINFNGNATSVDGLSLFANRCIENLRAENITGRDRVYGDWATDPITGSPNEHNEVPRANDRAGAAALGGAVCDSPSGIDYNPTSNNNQQKSGTANPQRYGLRDLDSASLLTSVSGSRRFAEDTWSEANAPQPPDTVTFPFATGDEAADSELLAQLKQRAIDQGNYVRRPSGDKNFKIDDGTGDNRYPRASTLDTVFFVEFAEGDTDNPVYGALGSAEYRARTSNSDRFTRGTLVVVNGDLKTSSSADDFEGAMLVRDGNGGDNNLPVFDNGGNLEIRGFVNVEGDMSLRGNVGGVLPGELINGIPGAYTVNLWSWRECYSEDCN